MQSTADIIKKPLRFSPPPPIAADGRRDLGGISREKLAHILSEMGEKPFRDKQIWHWLYHRGVQDFSQMSSISKPLQEKLAQNFVITRPHLERVQTSKDGTRKFLFKFRDGQMAETVFIPDSLEERGAVCLSSQIGCTLSCSFCHTGTQKLVRNLGADEIVGQFTSVRDYFKEWPTPRNGEPRLVSNIVIMGMGEPLYNYDNIREAMKIIMDEEGIALSRRRITLSTAGIVPLIPQCGAELGVNLAISLHAVTNTLRDKLVPINKKYPIEEVLQACRDYPRARNARRITFEYILLDGVNDSDKDAKQLVQLMRGIHAKVNLIPFNPWPSSLYRPSPLERQERFSQIINNGGFSAPIRTPRGNDILAACGQLKTASERKKAHLRK